MSKKTSAGRPYLDGSSPKFGKYAIRYTVTLSREEAAHLTRLGISDGYPKGNLSAGIRQVLAYFRSRSM